MQPFPRYPRQRPHITRRDGKWIVLPGVFSVGVRRNYVGTKNWHANRYAYELNEGIR